MPLHTFLLWFLLTWGMGWAAFPLVHRVLGRTLPDGGLATGRILFLGLWSLLTFWLGHMGISTKLSAWLGIGFVLAGLGLGWHQKHTLRPFITERRTYIKAVEITFIAVFLAFFLLRGFWSDTNGTNGEKSMDSALIGSLTRAQSLPPENPYSAGTKLQAYYYFGHLGTALLTNGVGTTNRWSYNLMCATIPALCFSSLLALSIGISGTLKRGAGATAVVLLLGTLSPIQQLVIKKQPNPSQLFRLDFFGTSRIIPFTINEYPWFTFNQADLHAHYFDFLFTLSLLSVLWVVYRGEKRALWLIPPLLAAQILTNTWDFPIAAILTGLVLLFRMRAREGKKSLVTNYTDLILSTILAVTLTAFAVGLAFPYLQRLKTAASLPSPLAQPASPLLEWLLLWGPFLIAFGLFIVLVDSWKPLLAALVGAGLGLSVIKFASGLFTPVLACILTGAILSVALTWRLRDEKRFLCLLAFAGFLALLWAETTWSGFLGSHNTPGPEDYKRQDTVFKFGLQTWFYLGTAAAVGAALTWKRWAIPAKFVAVWAACIMLISSLAVTAGRTKNLSRWDGWDAWAHLRPSEKAAAAWLQQHVRPGEAIMEAEMRQGGDYSEYTRYAHATGIPTIIGPMAHSFQWAPAHSGDIGKEWTEVMRRKQLARTAYTNLDIPAVQQELKKLGVRYVVIGQLEVREYGEYIRRFEGRLPIAFDAPSDEAGYGVTILDLGHES